MKKILLVTDFSQSAEIANDYAIQLFGNETVGEQISYTFLHIHEPAAVVAPHSGVYMPTTSKFIADDIQLIEKRLSSYVLGFRKKYPVSLFHENVAMGPTVLMIREIALKDRIDVIVAGTNGIHGMDRNLFGSTSLTLAQEAPCPVLIVPKESEIRLPEKIVFATDFNNIKNQTVHREVKVIADSLNCDLMLLHIHKKNSLEVDAHQHVESLKEYFANRNFDFYFLEEDNIVKGIRDFMVGYDADILVLAAHERPFFEKIFHRSVRKRVLGDINIPLLLLHSLQWKKDKKGRDHVG